MKYMRNNEHHMRGPCPVPTPTERERVKKIIEQTRERLQTISEHEPPSEARTLFLMGRDPKEAFQHRFFQSYHEADKVRKGLNRFSLDKPYHIYTVEAVVDPETLERVI